MTSPKSLTDLDSLSFSHQVLFREGSSKKTSQNYSVILKVYNPLDHSYIRVYYLWMAPDLTYSGDSPTQKAFVDTIPDQGTWQIFECDPEYDLTQIKGLPSDLVVDTFMIYGEGVNVNGLWRGQKAFFDAIRLTGYADYDVGVKEITSASSAAPGVPYTPEARIKNFGRENADEFLVIAEIEDSTGIFYLDTVPNTLTGDTEDTLAFVPCTFTVNGTYTLTIRTYMTLDECDEDDELSIPLIVSGIDEILPLRPQIKLEANLNRLSYEAPGEAILSIYNSLGRKVESITVKGSGEVVLGKGMPSGVYFVRLQSRGFIVTKKTLVLDK